MLRKGEFRKAAELYESSIEGLTAHQKAYYYPFSVTKFILVSYKLEKDKEKVDLWREKVKRELPIGTANTLLMQACAYVINYLYTNYHNSFGSLDWTYDEASEMVSLVDLDKPNPTDADYADYYSTANIVLGNYLSAFYDWGFRGATVLYQAFQRYPHNATLEDFNNRMISLFMELLQVKGAPILHAKIRNWAST